MSIPRTSRTTGQATFLRAAYSTLITPRAVPVVQSSLPSLSPTRHIIHTPLFPSRVTSTSGNGECAAMLAAVLIATALLGTSRRVAHADSPQAGDSREQRRPTKTPLFKSPPSIPVCSLEELVHRAQHSPKSKALEAIEGIGVLGMQLPEERDQQLLDITAQLMEKYPCNSTVIIDLGSILVKIITREGETSLRALELILRLLEDIDASPLALGGLANKLAQALPLIANLEVRQKAFNALAEMLNSCYFDLSLDFDYCIPCNLASSLVSVAAQNKQLGPQIEALFSDLLKNPQLDNAIRQDIAFKMIALQHLKDKS